MVLNTSRDALMGKIERGRHAGLAAGIVKPLIEQKISEQLKLLVARYRDSEITHDDLVGGIGGISALMGLMSDLERTHNQGNKAIEAEYATSRPD